MQRFLVTGAALALLALPSAAYAFRTTPGDGTLSVKGGSGVVVIVARGGVIGQIDRGRVMIDDPNPDDGGLPVVSGYERLIGMSDTRWLYSGTDLRFRLFGGLLRIRIVGTGINLSFAGRGSVTLVGAGLFDNGLVSFDGGDTYRPLPPVLTTVPVGIGPSPTPGPPVFP